MSYPLPPTYSSTARQLHPYLGPRARLSLSWLSQHFLALLLVLVALCFLLSSIPVLVKDGKATLTAACSGVEGAASVAASLPHFMADGVNELNSKTISAVTNGAGTVLDLTLQGLEAIIIFMIDTYRSLFLCLLDLVVHGSLTLLVHAIEEAQEFVTEALSKIRDGIQSAIGGINTGLENSIGLIDKIPGVDIDVPTIDIPELSALENVTIPSTVVDALTDLNSSIPTLDEFRASMNSLISRPIELLRANINSTLSNRTIEVEMLPVPAKQTVEICTDLDTSWIDDVGDDLGKFVKVARGLVVLLMVLFMLACAVWEKYSYRNFIGGVMSAREAWIRDLVDESTNSVHPSSAEEALSKPNLLSFLNASSHPTLFAFVSRLQRLFSLRTSNAKSNLIWFFSYIAHPHAWAFLVLGLVGLLVVQIQLWALRGPVKDLTTKRANEGAGEFSNSVIGSLNNKLNESSYDFAIKSNRMILSVESGINEDLFGWVNGTTEALNTTINGFYDGLTDAITDVFDGTVLEDPILNLVYCLVGSKVDAISSALTWMHAHAHISLPTVSPTILMLSSNRSQELTEGLTSPDSAVSTTSIVDRMLEAYARSLEQQRLGFCIAIGIWVLVVVMGLIGVGWRSGGEEKWAHWRGRPIQREEKDLDEKPYFKPLHLRGHSTVSGSGRQSPPPKSPVDPRTVNQLAQYSFPHSPPPEGPLPPVPPQPQSSDTYLSTKSLQPSAASWASLVDFFRSTSPSPPESSSNPPPPPKDNTSKKRLELPAISLAIPRALRSKPSSNSKFNPRPFNISRPRPSSKHQRRDSDMVDLRTGQSVSRSVPGNGFGGFGRKVRGIGDDLMEATNSGRQREETTARRRTSTSLDGWHPLESPKIADRSSSPPTDTSNRFSFLPYFPPHTTLPLDDSMTTTTTNPFADPTAVLSPPTRSTSIQPPISPPPQRTILRGHQLAFDPFSDSHAMGEPRDNQRSKDPFATPFDE
ncbi:pheromone-regulated protein PRM1 [Sporobolomyces salmoneus]|uniref:pheromone-regulated protein PRM1 n=1 Tax=Sporobolomyces salmoneus TaxID=183962 RepID=UPI0031783B2B